MKLRALLLLCILLIGGTARADDYPSKSIRLIVPFAAGGAVGAVARVLSNPLSQSLGQSIVIDNRGGAGGIIGMDAVAKAPPDGYTLLLIHSGITYMPGLYRKLPFDPSADFDGIIAAVSGSYVLAVTNSAPFKTVAELISYAKANPGKLSYGVGNSTSQIVGEALKKRTQTDIVRVPYRSNPAVMTDLIANQIQIMIADFNTGMPQLKAGKVNALAVLTRDRHPLLPDVPTLNETVMPGYHILAWAGVFGPANMPSEAVKALAGAIEKALNTPVVRQRFASSGTDIYWSGPQEFDAFVKSELVSWTAMIKEAGIEPE